MPLCSFASQVHVTSPGWSCICPGPGPQRSFHRGPSRRSGRHVFLKRRSGDLVTGPLKRRDHRNEERQPTAHAKSWEAVLSRSEGGHTRLFLGIAHDVTARATLARIFEPFFQDQTDHKVECEERGDAALGRVESGLTFDVLLTDVLLPGVDGLRWQCGPASCAPACRSSSCLATRPMCSATNEGASSARRSSQSRSATTSSRRRFARRSTRQPVSPRPVAPEPGTGHPLLFNCPKGEARLLPCDRQRV